MPINNPITGGGTIYGDLSIESSVPKLDFIDNTAGDEDWRLYADADSFYLTNTTDAFDAFVFDGSGAMTILSSIQPASNDAGALGASGQAFSDLYLASGAQIDFAAGDVTITHSSNLLALTGGGISVSIPNTGNFTGLAITNSDVTNDPTTVSITQLADSPAIAVTPTATTFQNGVGAITVGRTGNITAVNNEELVDNMVAPVFTWTESAAGDNYYFLYRADASNVTVVADGATSNIASYYSKANLSANLDNYYHVFFEADGSSQFSIGPYGGITSSDTNEDGTNVIHNAFTKSWANADVGNAGTVLFRATSGGMTTSGNILTAVSGDIQTNALDAAGTLMASFVASSTDNGGSQQTGAYVVGGTFDASMLGFDGKLIFSTLDSSGSGIGYGVDFTLPTITDASSSTSYGVEITQTLNDSAVESNSYTGLKIDIATTDITAYGGEIDLLDVQANTSDGFSISTDGTGITAELYVVDDGAEGGEFAFTLETTIPAASDIIGTTTYNSLNDNSPQDEVVYAETSALIGLETTGSETGKYAIKVQDSQSASLDAPSEYIIADGTSGNENIQLLKNVVIGSGAAGVDYTLTFNGETNDGVLTWKEDEDQFTFADDVRVDGGIFLNSDPNTLYGFSTSRNLTPGAGNSSAAIHISGGGQITENTSGTHTVLAGISIDPITIVDGGGSEAVTNLAAFYIEEGPTAGTTPANGPYQIFADGVLPSRFDGLIIENIGGDLASANDMAAPAGRYQDVTGTTQINTMAVPSGVVSGTTVVVTLQFDGSVTVKHATAGSGAQFQLAGSGDFSATAGDTLTLAYDGTFWRELSRTAI